MRARRNCRVDKRISAGTKSSVHLFILHHTYSQRWRWEVMHDALHIWPDSYSHMCFYLYATCWCSIGPIWVLVPSGMVHLNHWIEKDWVLWFQRVKDRFVFHTLESENPIFLMTAPAEKPSLNHWIVLNWVYVYSAWLHWCRTELGDIGVGVFRKLMASLVESTMLYGSEIWGCNRGLEKIEQGQMRAGGYSLALELFTQKFHF